MINLERSHYVKIDGLLQHNGPIYKNRKHQMNFLMSITENSTIDAQCSMLIQTREFWENVLMQPFELYVNELNHHQAMYEIHPNDYPIVMFVIRLWMTYQTLKYILQNEPKLKISSTQANYFICSTINNWNGIKFNMYS